MIIKETIRIRKKEVGSGFLKDFIHGVNIIVIYYSDSTQIFVFPFFNLFLLIEHRMLDLINALLLWIFNVLSIYTLANKYI